MQITLFDQLIFSKHVIDVTRNNRNATLKQLRHLGLREPNGLLLHVDREFDLPIFRFEQHDSLFI